MNLNIDSAIFIGFLAINLVFGLFAAQGIKNTREYAIGDRNFSTATITATIIATIIGGGYFSIALSETYKQGLTFILIGLGDIISLLIIGYFFAPRISRFFGNHSVADTLGQVYGKKVRIICAIASILLAAGYLSIQIKILSGIMNLFFGYDAKLITIISAAVIIIYSTFGGVKSVVFTDIIQFVTFSIFIPSIAFMIWQSVDNTSLLNLLFTNPLYDYKEIFNYANPNFLNFVSVLIFFSIPALDPAIFHRTLIARTHTQIRQSFYLAALGCFIILIVTSSIAILLYSTSTSLDPQNLTDYIIQNYSHPGIKGLIAIGITAMIMSTADSYINSSVVAFSSDLFSLCKIKPENELTALRILTLSLGITSLILTFKTEGFIDLLLTAANFYMPIVTAPLIMLILGFQSTQKSVLIGMAAGIFTVLTWKLFVTVDVDSVVPGFIMNLVFFMGSHYLLGQGGGWVGVGQASTVLKELKDQRAKKFNKLIGNIKNFNLYIFCKKNSPMNDSTYAAFGLFSLVSICSSMYTVPIGLKEQYINVLDIIYHTVLIFSAISISYPLWPTTLKQSILAPVIWIVSITYTAAFASTVILMVSNFGQLQLMILILNLVVISIFQKWQFAIAIMLIGVTLGVEVFKVSSGMEYVSQYLSNAEYKIIYLLLLISTILITFLRPKQEQQELTEEKNEHLNIQVVAKIRETEEALALKGEFIRNMNHEYHAPMTGVISVAEGLQAGYDKLNDEKRKQAIDIIVESAHNLRVFDENLATLHELGKPNYKLNKENINFSELVYQRIQTCRRLYENNKDDREFRLNIAGDITINADKNYMIQLLDNLIINSISYCKKGKISIVLFADDNSTLLTITDEGIGIPTRELLEIFNPFTVSSKTKTPAGGRGVGLAICQRILEVHGGTIKAESKDEKGATFIVKLPL